MANTEKLRLNFGWNELNCASCWLVRSFQNSDILSSERAMFTQTGFKASDSMLLLSKSRQAESKTDTLGILSHIFFHFSELPCRLSQLLNRQPSNIYKYPSPVCGSPSTVDEWRFDCVCWGSVFSLLRNSSCISSRYHSGKRPKLKENWIYNVRRWTNTVYVLVAFKTCRINSVGSLGYSFVYAHKAIALFIGSLGCSIL